MQHPRWNDEIRIRASRKPDGRLSDEDWQYILDQGILEDEVDRVPESDQLEVLLKEIRRLRRDGELPRSRRSKSDAFKTRIQRGWITEDESTMAAAISDAMVQRAFTDPEVKRVRALVAEQDQGLSEQEIRARWAEGGFFSPPFVQYVIGLADEFGWDGEDTAVFLHTGQTPLVEPLRASVSIREFRDEHGAETPRSRARIVLEFDPWISKETVANAYEELRRELLGKGRKRPEFRELEVFRFVLPRLQENGDPRTSWSAIGREWNEKYAEFEDWKYSKEEDIQRAYMGVRRRLINAKYHVFGTEPSNPPLLGGAERGTYFRMFVDPRERSPMEAILAKRAREQES